jgi:DNA-binding transcriptional ArsR family regulator
MVNYMVKYSVLDRTFAALADPTRREILERLSDGPASVSELDQPSGMSMPGLLKHVRILEQAHLVTTQKQGRVRQCRLDPGHLDDAEQWIQAYRRRWERRLDRLGDYLERSRKGRRHDP